MSLKTVLPPDKPKPASGLRDTEPGPADFAARWAEARHSYPIYAALVTQFGLGRLPHPAGELPPSRPTREIFQHDLAWLDEVDSKIKAFHIRQLLPSTLNTSEESLRAFILRQLKKSDKDNADRDKIDFLLVQYFALCAPESLYHQQIELADVVRVLKPVLHEADPTPLEWCAPLEKILESVQKCQSLRDLLERGLLEQGRLLKESAGSMFYDPAALVAFCRFNFLLRRSFILLLHLDQKAVLDSVSQLEHRGVKTVDCRRAGFSAADPLTRIRQFAESWRQPYEKDYSQISVSHAFEQFLALRADLEEALAPARPVDSSAPEGPPAPEPTAKPKPKAARTPAAPDSKVTPAAEAPSDNAAPLKQTEQVSKTAPDIPAPLAPDKPARLVGPLRAEKASPKATQIASTGSALLASPEGCLECIWEQLIEAPPSRGRSMSTVILQDTKVLLSSWEVGAFVSEGGQDSEDLRRAVVARALLAVAIASRKRSGESEALESALAHARNEVTYFQGRIEQSKRVKNTEAAVNLGISTKRLLSVIEEAETLQA